MLRHVLPEPVDNFQDLPPWRSLVIRTAIEILRYVGGALVVPQTVLVETYAQEIFQGLNDAGIPVNHFLLHVQEDELVRRIKEDRAETSAAKHWRLNHVTRYKAALPWLLDTADVLDTTELPPQKAAHEIANRIRQA
jgi:hypothetical protein